MGGERGRLAGNGGAALVGDERDMVAALFQLARQRKGGDEMPAGAASGQHVMSAYQAHYASPI